MASSPWAKIESPSANISFEEIMSEQLAIGLESKEKSKISDTTAPSETSAFEIPQDILDCVKDIDTSVEDADEMIARMLQEQFDREYNHDLQRREKKYNGDAKLTISFANYRAQKSPDDKDACAEDDEYYEPIAMEDRKDWDRFETVEKEFNAIPKCGYRVNDDGKVLTKHDITMAGRRNAGRVMSFPPEFQTGDGAGFDMRLPNNVFNSLKVYSTKEQSRRHRIHDKKEDRATAEMGVDETTRLLLYKLVNRQMLERINGIISTGKEAVVLHADGDPTWTESVMPKECAIKVFKTTLSEFKQRDKYIKDDFRFKERFSKQNPRKTIHLWAEKEMHNLMRVKRAAIPCPDVVVLRKHILVMSFIGTNTRPASKLKDAILNAAQLIVAYDQVTDCMKKMFNDARLVHADLSEYNILWHDDKCWFIDVAQSVEHGHPCAFEFLLRDCGNISTFFTRKSVPGVKSAEELFVDIVGLDSATAIESTRKDNKRKAHLTNNQMFNEYLDPDVDDFEFAWAESKNHRSIIDDIETLKIIDPPKS